MGVATADFHLRGIETFLSELRVGNGGRALIVAPKSDQRSSCARCRS